MKPLAEVAKFEVVKKLSNLLGAIEHLEDSDYLIKILTQQLREVIADRLTSYVAGLDFNQSLNMETVLASQSARRRILTAIYFFDAVTELCEYDTYLQATCRDAARDFGGPDNADTFARLIMISPQPELGSETPATFIRIADYEDLTRDALPSIITNLSMRLPHENVEVLWQKQDGS